MRPQTSRILTTLIVISFLIILLANSKTITSSTRTSVGDIVSLPLKTLHNIASSLKRIVPFAGLREENRILRQRINLLTRQLDEIKVLEDENQRLRRLLDFRKSIPYVTVPVQVIGRDPSNWSGSLILDKGVYSGIKQNRVVLSTRGLVGRVLETGRYSSKVLLITDPNSKVGVIIQRNRQGGILVGRPDGKCKMIYIALDSDVAIGDKVITAGLGGIFPKDILVGKVTRVDKEPARLYKYAIVQPAEDMSRLEEVLCIK